MPYLGRSTIAELQADCSPRDTGTATLDFAENARRSAIALGSGTDVPLSQADFPQAKYCCTHKVK